MNSSMSFFDKCTVVQPSLPAWFYVFSVHGVCSLAGGVPLGSLLYCVLTKGSGCHKVKKERNVGKNSMTTLFSGVFVGIFASASIYIARPVIETCAPNAEISFIGLVFAATFGFASFFKCLNVSFGTYPEGADVDLQRFLLWFVMMPEPTFNKGKLSKASWRDIGAKLCTLLFKFVTLLLLLTVLMHHRPHYQVMTEKPKSFSLQEDIYNNGGSRALNWLIPIHVNGFLHLWLLYSFFSFSLDLSTITNYVISGGVRMESGFCNPLLGSRSFKETWGSRWNRPVNALLKRSVYIPALKSGYFNREQSAILAFFASGLLHEYNFTIHNHRSLSSPSGYRPGEVTVFFLLMGVLVILESWVWHRCFPRWLQTVINWLPSAVIATMLTFIVAGLAERYFVRAWIQSGFVEGLAQIVPYLSCR